MTKLIFRTFLSGSCLCCGFGLLAEALCSAPPCRFDADEDYKQGQEQDDRNNYEMWQVADEPLRKALKTVADVFKALMEPASHFLSESLFLDRSLSRNFVDAHGNSRELDL